MCRAFTPAVGGGYLLGFLTLIGKSSNRAYAVKWAEYWDGETTIYASDRHKRVHYARIADDIVRLLPGQSEATVVDYGCGDALSAHIVADRCSRLLLCESAITTRGRLAARYAGRGDIEVISPDDFAALPPRTIDLIVANSVIQYLSREELARFLELAREKLRPAGHLVLADVIPRHIGVLGDAAQLLRFAAANGFLLAACAGLVRSFFSSYRRIRGQLGLLQFDEAEMLDILRQAGFEAGRHHPNVGHNNRRMTFVAAVQTV